MPAILLLLALAAALLGALSGCATDNDGGLRPTGPNVADCVGCHTDRNMLVATAKPDTSGGGESSGEG